MGRGPSSTIWISVLMWIPCVDARKHVSDTASKAARMDSSPRTGPSRTVIAFPVWLVIPPISWGNLRALPIRWAAFPSRRWNGAYRWTVPDHLCPTMWIMSQRVNTSWEVKDPVGAVVLGMLITMWRQRVPTECREQVLSMQRAWAMQVLLGADIPSMSFCGERKMGHGQG